MPGQWKQYHIAQTVLNRADHVSYVVPIKYNLTHIILTASF